MIKTPAYLYSVDVLKQRIELIRKYLPNIPLTYSIKANSFLLKYVVNYVAHVEVCSPGELAICKELGVPSGKIIYSGVMKELYDITDALGYGVGIITAESMRQYELIKEASRKMRKKVNVLLRLTSGNQFGMSDQDIFRIIGDGRKNEESVKLVGIHYYSGTNKNRVAKIEKDFSVLREFLEVCEESYQFVPEIVEVGPGLASECFGDNNDELYIKDEKLISSCQDVLLQFAKKYPLRVEMGRFIATPCGEFHTTVKDIKTSDGVNYVIVDGGINQLKYYGQMMAMNTPVVSQHVGGRKRKKYCICGSLCTVADVLIREIEIDEVEIGDVLVFYNCGAYSLTEASTMFLSRDMAGVYVNNGETIEKVRDQIFTYIYNF